MNDGVKIVTISDGEVTFSGIGKVKSKQLQALCAEANVPEGQKKLKSKNVHMTLFHQSLLKPVKDIFKQAILGGLKAPAFDVIVDIKTRSDEFGLTAHGAVESRRESRVFYLTNESQERMQAWCSAVLADLQVREREERKFHVSISNLQGHSGASPR